MWYVWNLMLWIKLKNNHIFVSVYFECAKVKKENLRLNVRIMIYDLSSSRTSLSTNEKKTIPYLRSIPQAIFFQTKQ